MQRNFFGSLYYKKDLFLFFFCVGLGLSFGFFHKVKKKDLVKKKDQTSFFFFLFSLFYLVFFQMKRERKRNQKKD